jgi:two-component system, OmpR family, sensor histidine kinase KdpD
MMKQLNKQFLPMFSRLAAALFCIAATKILLLPIQENLEVQIIELIYLLPVMLSTVLWGLTPGILAGFAAFLVFNYFHIQPYNTLLVHQTQDVITLVIFLFIAVVLSQLIGKARDGMRLANIREWEATRMYELISALAGLKDVESIARNLALYSLQTFLFDRIEILINRKGEDVLLIAEPVGTTSAAPPTMVFPLETARAAEGEIRIWHERQELSSQETRLLKAYASQGALALERVHLAKGENKVRILEESDQLKSSLLNSVSHELRTPLSAIKAAVSSLRSGAVEWNTNSRQDLLAMVEEETDQLNQLVGNLLDMSRIEAGALKPLRRWNAIDEIVIGTVNKMRTKLTHHHLETHFSENLTLVPTDFVMIGQVFQNLLSNSIKYAPVGSTISIYVCKEKDNLHVKLSNQGPPVPGEHLERIFNKFHRVTEAERITGTGLGLSICKGIIEAHGGKIWAENEPGRFAFHFYLPLTLNGSLPDIPEEESDE